MQENQSIRTQHVELAEIAAKLVDHNRVLTEAAPAAARTCISILSDRAAAVTSSRSTS